MLARLQVLSKSKAGGAPIRVELEHFHRIAEVEVEDFVRSDGVHLGKRPWLQQIVDC